MHPFDLIPCDGTGITADKIYRPRKLMTVEQAKAMLVEASKHKKGAIPEEFLNEALEVLK